MSVAVEAESEDATVGLARLLALGLGGLRLRSRISSDVSALNRIHRTFNWIPNESQIRPTPEQLERKRARMNELAERWASMGDFVLHEVFGKGATKNAENRLCAVDDAVCASDVVFHPSHFAYDVPLGGHHWVMWFGCREPPPTNVSECIVQRLREHLGHDAFDFAWYPNPKMSIPEFYHVHVFWVTLDETDETDETGDGRIQTTCTQHRTG